jgi:hypothetical protein
MIAALLAAGALSVTATFDTPTVRFGDPIATHIVVRVPEQVQASSVRVLAGPGPLTWLSPASTKTEGSLVTVDRTATCIDDRCVAPKGDATPALRRVVVTATTRDGRTLRAETSWPTLRVRGRVSAADLERSRPPFRVDTTPPPPSYSTNPSTLAWLLYAAAAVLVVVALALAVPPAVRLFRRTHPPAPVDELARAIRLAREAEDRPDPDKRRALGLLSRLLRERRLAETASDLAWSKPAPQRESLAALVGEAEREAPS